MNILLLGFMGTGKSTIAPFLASHFALEVVSTDQLVEEKIGESISEIFRTKGEVEFRCAERTVLLELIGRESLLIDCGGGITLDPKNREILTSLGTTICLTCSPKILEKRLVDTQRPLLSEGDLGKQIAKLLKERSLAYQGFQMTIDTTNLSVNETIREIITQLEK